MPDLNTYWINLVNFYIATFHDVVIPVPSQLLTLWQSLKHCKLLYTAVDLLLGSLFFFWYNIDYSDKKLHPNCDKSINFFQLLASGVWKADPLLVPFTLPDLPLTCFSDITFKALISFALLDLYEVTVKIMDLHIKQA